MTRVVKWTLLLVVFLGVASAMATKLSGQLPPHGIALCNDHLPACPLAERRPLHLQPDTALTRDAWDYDIECTGISPMPGYGFEDVLFVVVTTYSLFFNRAYAYGYWADGVILLDSAFYEDPWLLRHELMHQLLVGPPISRGGYHPWNPFAFPCELMTFQHVPGGIMGQRAR